MERTLFCSNTRTWRLRGRSVGKTLISLTCMWSCESDGRSFIELSTFCKWFRDKSRISEFSFFKNWAHSVSAPFRTNIDFKLPKLLRPTRSKSLMNRIWFFGILIIRTLLGRPVGILFKRFAVMSRYSKDVFLNMPDSTWFIALSAK